MCSVRLSFSFFSYYFFGLFLSYINLNMVPYQKVIITIFHSIPLLKGTKYCHTTETKSSNFVFFPFVL